MTIVIGNWAIPAAITICFFFWALVPRIEDRKSGDYDFTFWIPAAFRLAGAIIGSLLVWLIYFIWN